MPIKGPLEIKSYGVQSRQSSKPPVVSFDQLAPEAAAEYREAKRKQDKHDLGTRALGHEWFAVGYAQPARRQNEL